MRASCLTNIIPLYVIIVSPVFRQNKHTQITAPYVVSCWADFSSCYVSLPSYILIVCVLKLPDSVSVFFPYRGRPSCTSYQTLSRLPLIQYIYIYIYIYIFFFLTFSVTDRKTKRIQTNARKNNHKIPYFFNICGSEHHALQQ